MTFFVFLFLAIIPLLVDMWTRRPGRESIGRALTWSSIYIASASLFATYLFVAEGADRAGLFASGYVIEKAMSMDNLIIFSAIFAYFGVRPEHEHRILHWGIVGSAVLRMVFIAAGLAAFFIMGRLLDLLFGGFVIITAWKMMGGGESESIDHGARWYIRWTKRIFPVSTEMNGQFFVREPHGLLKRVPSATPLLFCLIAIEFTDIAFAFDSVPAVIGITRDAMLAYSAVMFAVLGLRSLYFVLESLKSHTEYLAKSVTAILYYVGGKMILHGIADITIPTSVTMGVIFGCLLIGGIAGAFVHKTERA